MLAWCLLDPWKQLSLWNLNQNTTIFIQGNGFQNFICNMAVILCQLVCVNVMAWCSSCQMGLLGHNELIQWTSYNIFLSLQNLAYDLNVVFRDFTHVILTHWGRVRHICAGNLTIIGSDNGLSPGQHQAIIWTNVGLLSIGTLGTNFSKILIEIQTFSCKNMLLNISSGKWWPFCLGLNVLKVK